MSSAAQRAAQHGYFFAAALFAAQRFFRAATILALPSAVSFRVGFFAGLPALVGAVPEAVFFSAHRFLCASAIAFRPAALIFRRGGFPAVEGD
jgi:hypothetical protein